MDSNGPAGRCSLQRIGKGGNRDQSWSISQEVASELSDRYNCFYKEGTARPTTGHHVDTPVGAQSLQIEIKMLKTMPTSFPPHRCVQVLFCLLLLISTVNRNLQQSLHSACNPIHDSGFLHLSFSPARNRCPFAIL